MSQSPLGSTDAPERSYLDSWGNLARMIQQGRSFSGRERNCCFLNVRGEEFADVSGAAGLDLIDDGRTVAVVDWDRDGDLDLWLANRTGPRVRFLRNDAPTRNRFLSLRLVGDPRRRCNRDAVGARLELYLADDARTRLVRTLYAGDGYLSQSSKWVHFGLGQRSAIDRLVVRWPGKGKAETFRGLDVDRRYKIAQGVGSAEPVDGTLERRPLEPSIPEAPKVSDAGRIRLASPVQVPDLAYRSLDGRTRSLGAHKGPLLVNLWATWCRPCLVELQDFADHRREIDAAGLSILALGVDGIGDSRTADAASEKDVLAGLGWRFDAGLATAELIETLDNLQRRTVYRSRQLPVPTSFLLDRSRRLVAVYKGKVSTETLLADVKTIDTDPEKLRDLAVPFPGRWSDEHFVTHPIAISQVYLQGNHPDDARDHLERHLEKDPGPPSPNQTAEGRKRNLQLADVHYMLGRISALGKRREEAVKSYREALQFHPALVPAHIDLATVLAADGREDEAAAQLLGALEIDGKDPRLHNQLGVIRWRQGRPRDALRHYRAALASQPGFVAAANNLAWLLATSPDDELRDGRQALRLARQVCESTGFKQPSALDTLAAAYAELGTFDEAVRTAERATQLATLQGLERLAREIAERLALYRTGQPFRDAAAPTRPR